MSSEEILKAVAGVGFPTAVAVYLLIAFGNKLDKLTEAVNNLTHRANSTLCPGKNFPFIQMLDSLRNGEPFFGIGEDYPYIKEIKYLKEKGIIKGDGRGYLHPGNFITREKAVLIVYRMMKLILQQFSIYRL